MTEITPQLVQTIVVKPSTHLDTVAAAALASGLALAHAEIGAGELSEMHESDSWQSWLSGSFTKSVRRVKTPADLARVRALELMQFEVSVGDAVGIAFVPAPYAQSPREISRLQVSGLDLAHESDRFHRTGAVMPHIEINADVTMSTGKTAAQVAHALGAWLLTQPLGTRRAWAAEPGLALSEVSFTDHEMPESSDVITIVDNGLTEIAPGTATARVCFNAFA